MTSSTLTTNAILNVNGERVNFGNLHSIPLFTKVLEKHETKRLMPEP